MWTCALGAHNSPRNLLMRRSQLAAGIALGAIALVLVPAVAQITSQVSVPWNADAFSDRATPNEEPKPEAPKHQAEPEPNMVVHHHRPILPAGLPTWFYDIDEDEDGQITLSEWRKGGKHFDDFRKYDVNDDGFITPEEILQFLRKPTELKLISGQASYSGAIEAGDEGYRSKKLTKSFAVKLERGKTYQFDHMSKAFDAYLYLADTDGEVLARDDDGGEGTNSRILYRAVSTGIYRLVATSLSGNRTGAFSFAVRLLQDFGGISPISLPPWFKDLDKDGDGQVALYEWRAGGKGLNDFRAYDLNDDGFITAEEVLRYLKEPIDLKFTEDLAKFTGVVEEVPDERFRGKKSFKIFTIYLEHGKTYQIDHTSKVFQGFLYLLDADGNKLRENSSPNIGGNSRIVHYADRSGLYRIVATSLGGYRTGPFTITVRSVNGFGGISPKGLPAWFKDLDLDGDGQVALYEWRQAGKKFEDFREFDLNDDGFITAEEILRYMKDHPDLKDLAKPSRK
jgi:Ca2+-binding EF-hand superfamily protein